MGSLLAACSSIALDEISLLFYMPKESPQHEFISPRAFKNTLFKLEKPECTHAANHAN